MLTRVSKKIILVSKKIYWREILACLLLFIGVYFLRKQRNEMNSIIPYLHQARQFWIVVAALVTIIFIGLQSAMYVSSFRSVHSRLKWVHAVELFLKRNLLGVFIPGGGVSALAFVPINIKKAVPLTVRIHQASGVFAFAGMVSTFIVGLPVLFMNAGNRHWLRSVTGLAVTALLMIFLIYLFRALKGKGKLFQWLEKRFPSFAAQLHELIDASVIPSWFGIAIISSVGVELCGIMHLYIAMLAIGAPASLSAAGIAYIVSLLLMIASPFLKGLGAVELSLVYILSQYGYSPAQALAITIIYRAFEFWLPMACGLIAFLFKGRHLFLRIAPALSILILGIINILSVITPPIVDRIHFIRYYLPATAIHASNILVLFIGFTLIATAAYLIKGLRNAWYIALSVSFISIFGHLFKAFDYEEAIISAVVFLILFFTRKNYKIKSNPRLVNTGFKVALLSFLAILIYGFIGFYFLEKRHFGVDFSWHASLINSVRGFLLLEPQNLEPKTRFAREFLRSFHVLGFLCWLFLFYTIIRPYLNFSGTGLLAREKAVELIEKYGCSALDYFKTASEKLIYISRYKEGFVSYCISGSFAVVLEEPVCAFQDKEAVILEFEKFAHKTGLKTAYYRVDQQSLSFFNQLKKKKLLIGQEALLELKTFDLAGRTKKSLRNALNSLSKKGYQTSYLPAPHSDMLIAELKAVSDEWLTAFGKKELVFSQGMFDEEELKNQDIIVTRNADGRIVAFLNLIPDFAPEECTYDMIRKTREAPGGCMDALIIELIHQAKIKGLNFLNLGLVPMTGMAQPQNTAEQFMQFAYRKLKRFRQYQGLREFKEKYASQWQNKYLVYEADFDLLQLPGALNKIMQPKQ